MGANPQTRLKSRASRAMSRKADQLPQMHSPVSQQGQLFPTPPSLQAMNKVEDPRRVSVGSSNNFSDKIFSIIFYLHLLIVTILTGALLIHGFLLSPKRRHRFHALNWLLPLFASVGCAAISALAWLLFTQYRPSAALKAAFWLSPCLTLATGVLLVSAGSPGDLGIGILAIFSAVALSIYGCWVIPHLRHAVRVLQICTTSSPPNNVMLTVLAILASTVYTLFLVTGIGGARAGIKKLDIYAGVSIAIILISMGWTMQVIKNILRVTFSRIQYLKFLQDMDTNTFMSFKETIVGSTGTICIGSLLVPVIGLIRGSARAMENASGGSDEFMFSCTDCYSSLASKLIRHGNQWGFVQVGAYNKGIMQASRDTWELFEKANIVLLIDSDITNSFCFLSGVAGGALSSLLGGICAFVVHRGYTTEVSIYAFLIGYFMTRIAMAWPQASVLAYYVAYSENPDCTRFEGTIEVRMHELQRYKLNNHA